MSAAEAAATPPRAVLLCSDGSTDALHAIGAAARVLSSRRAVVLSVWEPVRLWEPHDPVTVLSVPLTRLAASALELDDVARELAHEQAAAGAELARGRGFDARARVVQGKPWRVICELGLTLDVEAIVLGARGLGRVGAALLGSVSAAVLAHAQRPVLVVPREGAHAAGTRPAGAQRAGT